MAEGFDEAAALAMVAGLEAGVSILWRLRLWPGAKERGIVPDSVTNFQAVTGKELQVLLVGSALEWGMLL